MSSSDTGLAAVLPALASLGLAANADRWDAAALATLLRQRGRKSAAIERREARQTG